MKHSLYMQLFSARQTMLYLTRLALAANRPDRAQAFIKKALGMDQD